LTLKKEAKTFPTDKEKGGKLFIKALKLCQQPLYQYNLGIAYYQYGNAAEAEKYLAKAVAADDSHAKWLGDYAAVILARGGDAKKALKLAEKASRLPTESEWEYAARSGGRDETYAGGNDVDRVSWYDGNSGGSTHPVGGKAPNGLGFYDMSGNV